MFQQISTYRIENNLSDNYEQELNTYFSPQFNIQEFVKNDYESELMVFNDSNQKWSNSKQLKNYHIETAYKLTPKSESSWDNDEESKNQHIISQKENQSMNFAVEPQEQIKSWKLKITDNTCKNEEKINDDFCKSKIDKFDFSNEKQNNCIVYGILSSKNLNFMF